MRRITAWVPALPMVFFAGNAMSANASVQGKRMICSSMYRFVLDKRDKALREEYLNLQPGGDQPCRD